MKILLNMDSDEEKFFDATVDLKQMVEEASQPLSGCFRNYDLRHRITYKDIYELLRRSDHLQMRAITITTNHPKVVRLATQDQYDVFVKYIKSVFNRTLPYRFLIYFEVNKSGNIHGHGITLDDSKNEMNKLKFLGQRNTDNTSHQRLNDLKKYFNYIIKDQYKDETRRFKPLTNFRLKDFKKFEYDDFKPEPELVDLLEGDSYFVPSTELYRYRIITVDDQWDIANTEAEKLSEASHGKGTPEMVMDSGKGPVSR